MRSERKELEGNDVNTVFLHEILKKYKYVSKNISRDKI